MRRGRSVCTSTCLHIKGERATLARLARKANGTTLQLSKSSRYEKAKPVAAVLDMRFWIRLGETTEEKVLFVKAEPTSSISDCDDNPHYVSLSPTLPTSGIVLR